MVTHWLRIDGDVPISIGSVNMRCHERRHFQGSPQRRPPHVDGSCPRYEPVRAIIVGRVDRACLFAAGGHHMSPLLMPRSSTTICLSSWIMIQTNAGPSQSAIVVNGCKRPFFRFFGLIAVIIIHLKHEGIASNQIVWTKSLAAGRPGNQHERLQLRDVNSTSVAIHSTKVRCNTTLDQSRRL